VSKYKKLPVFFISDRTGITAETLGHTLLTQFGTIKFGYHTLPFINSLEKTRAAVETINHSATSSGYTPLIFSTLIDEECKEILAQSRGSTIDFFEAFIKPLEKQLGTHSSHTTGLSHGISNETKYMGRIEALNFTLSNDDGVSTRHYPAADVLIVGASRSGKTPTCLNLALQFGLRAANYPLTEEDVLNGSLPESLAPYKDKIFGLTISPERLHRIREKRRPDSAYASLKQCQKEVRTIEALFHHEDISYADTSQISIEEISTIIMEKMAIKRRSVN
jgi:regulator of PEP synthase PpsR (kinase-PPPase family)